MGQSRLRVSLVRLLEPMHAGIGLGRGARPHPDRSIHEHEIFFVRRGRLAIGEEGRDLETAMGESLVLWPHRRHYGKAVVPAECEFYWLHVRVPAVGAGEPVITVPQRGRPARPARVMELWHRYLHDQSAGRLTPASAHALVLLLLSELADQRTETPTSVPADGALATLAARAQTEIARAFHRPLSTSTIAHRLGCNPDYLGRAFQRVYGHSVLDRIHRLRIDEACRLLLEEPGMPVPEVGKRCGFSQAAWFRRAFHRQMGVAPIAYRRLHGWTWSNS